MIKNITIANLMISRQRETIERAEVEISRLNERIAQLENFGAQAPRRAVTITVEL